MGNEGSPTMVARGMRIATKEMGSATTRVFIFEA